MSNEDKKISQLPQATTLQGSELLLYGGAANGSVSAATLKAYAREGLATQEQLDTKLDKEVWDDEHEQFGNPGYYLINGTYGDSQSYGNSGFIVINRAYDIHYITNSGGNVSSVVFFDSNKQFLSAIQGTSNVAQTIPSSEIPDAACFFVVSSYKQTGISYSNGPTQESREGAVSDAITASKLALFVDMWNTACDSSGKYDPVNAPDAQHPFYLNKLWLTYEEALLVMDAGRVSTDNYTNLYRGKKIRTTLKPNLSNNTIIADNTWTGSTVESVDASLVCAGDEPFRACSNLVRITNIYSPNRPDRNTSQTFVGCTKLQSIDYIVRVLPHSFSLKDSPLLDLPTFRRIVTAYADTSAITITVHPDVYAKLTHSEGVESYLPANIASLVAKGSPNTSINLGAIEIIRENRDTFWTVTLDSTITLNAGNKLTLSMDVEGLAENETYDFTVSLNTNPTISLSGAISLHNGRCTATFTAPKTASFNKITVDDSIRNGLDMSITTPIRISNVKLSQGEYAELPYTEPLSSIEDDAIREQAEWANLIYLAAAKNITFATT